MTVGELSRCNVVGVCGAVVEVDFLKGIDWVVEDISDSELATAQTSNCECSHISGLGDIIVSSAHVKGTGYRR